METRSGRAGGSGSDPQRNRDLFRPLVTPSHQRNRGLTANYLITKKILLFPTLNSRRVKHELADYENLTGHGAAIPKISRGSSEVLPRISRQNDSGEEGLAIRWKHGAAVQAGQGAIRMRNGDLFRPLGTPPPYRALQRGSPLPLNCRILHKGKESTRAEDHRMRAWGRMLRAAGLG